MRQSLIARGLIDAEFRLTSAGNDHARALIEQLRRVQVEEDDSGSRAVRWQR